MPTNAAAKSLRETYRGSLLLERLAGNVFPDAGALQASGCFSSLLFYDTKCPDFCIRLSDYFMEAAPDWDEGGRENPILMFQFALQGDLHYQIAGMSKQVMTEGQYNLFTIASLKEISWFDPSNSHTTTLDIYFSSFYLQKLTTGYPELSRLLARRRLGVSGQLGASHGSVCADMMRVLLAMINCNYTGDLKRIYMQSKVAELLLPALERLVVDLLENGSPIPLKRYDIQKLQESREYLLQNMENPPTLKELAQKMGMNDFKLKKGYKQFFGATIVEDFQRARMERALRVLLETDKTVMEIALLSGYQDVSNFTKAFSRYFGFPPGHFQKLWAARRK